MKLVSLALLLASLGAYAEQKGSAVATPNIETSIALYDNDVSRAISLSGAYTAPIGPYLGSKVEFSATKDNGKEMFADVDRYRAGLGLFARDSEFGKLSLAYSRRHSRFDIDISDDTYDTNIYLIGGDYYKDSLSLHATRQIISPEDWRDIHIWVLGASYYPNDNIKLNLSGSGMDAKDIYLAQLEMQPDMLRNEASLAISYGKSREDKSYQLTFSYFFGTTVSLIERDRTLR